MEKRERLERAINGDALDRVPVCLWRHWQGDDQRTADLARSVVNFQQFYDWDFAVVAPSNHFCLTGFGLQDEWQGNPTGERTPTKYPIKRSLDWTELRPLDPLRGDLAKQLECLRLIGERFDGQGVPYLQVVYSPLSQAMRLGGFERFITDLRTQPDRIHSGLNALTESTLRFIESLKKTSTAGIYYVIEGADYAWLAETEYMTFGLPYDQKIFSSLPNKWWLNTLSIRGKSPMLRCVSELPAPLVNWQDAEATPDLEKGKPLFRGAVMGGLSRHEHVHLGTPLTIKDATRQALNLTNGRRFILSCDAGMLITTPQSNIQTIRDIVQMAVI